MRKSTLFFAALAMVFATMTGLMIRHLLRLEPISPTVQGAGDAGVAPASGEPPVLEAASAVTWNTEKGEIVWQQNAFERRPVASLTKLMTAIVALDHGMPWEQTALINPDEYGLGGNLLLHNGEAVTMRDLFIASLLGSANNATRAYVRMLGVSEEEFLHRMNRKAIALGLEQTYFTDVTGLKATNVSTAYEMARLAEVAFRDYPDIARATAQAEYSFTVTGSGREHTIKNTNRLVTDHLLAVTGSKTGYLDEAKYCLVIQGSAATKNLVVVVLGSAAQTTNEEQVYKLLDLAR